MKDNLVIQKSFKYAVRIVKLYKFLQETQKEFVMSKQLMRSGTSVGANVKEAIRAVSKKDFSNKMAIALKEVSESEYWLELLRETQYLDDAQSKSILDDCIELIKLLTSIVKKSNMKSE